MDKAEIIARLRPIMATYVADQEVLNGLDGSTDFIRDLKINSANLVDIVLDTEEEFGIEIDNASMERMLNIGEAVEIIESKLAEK